MPRTFAFLVSCLLLAGTAHAAGGAASAPSSPPPGPPPEAVAACKGKSEGTQVNFSARGGETLTGVCQRIAEVLAARPLGGPPGGGAGKPPAR